MYNSFLSIALEKLFSTYVLPKGVKRDRKGVTWPTFKILGPLHTSGTVGARNFTFSVQIHHQG